MMKAGGDQEDGLSVEISTCPLRHFLLRNVRAFSRTCWRWRIDLAALTLGVIAGGGGDAGVARHARQPDRHDSG